MECDVVVRSVDNQRLRLDVGKPFDFDRFIEITRRTLRVPIVVDDDRKW